MSDNQPLRPGAVIEVVNPNGLGLGLISNVSEDGVITGYSLYNNDPREIKGKAQWEVESVIGVVPEIRGAVTDIDFKDSEGYLVQGYSAIFNDEGVLYFRLEAEKFWHDWKENTYISQQKTVRVRQLNTIEGAVTVAADTLKSIGDPQAEFLRNAREVFEGTLKELLF